VRKNERAVLLGILRILIESTAKLNEWLLKGYGRTKYI